MSCTLEIDRIKEAFGGGELHFRATFGCREARENFRSTMYIAHF